MEKYLANKGEKKSNNPPEGDLIDLKYLAVRGKHHLELSRDDTPIYWLNDLDISEDQSSDWQMAASLPDEEFERQLAMLYPLCIKSP